MLKTWRILDKLYLQDEKSQAGLVMLEYNFVETDLRNFIRKQSDLDEKISKPEVTKIFQDLIENLCYYHLDSTLVQDIRP